MQERRVVALAASGRLQIAINGIKLGGIAVEDDEVLDVHAVPLQCPTYPVLTLIRNLDITGVCGDEGDTNRNKSIGHMAAMEREARIRSAPGSADGTWRTATPVKRSA